MIRNWASKVAVMTGLVVLLTGFAEARLASFSKHQQ